MSIGLRPGEHLKRDLITVGVISELWDDRHRRDLSFTYHEVRDYVIAIHTKRLDSLSSDEFEHALDELFACPYGQNAAQWYYEATTRSDHRKAFEQRTIGKAKQFLAARDALLSHHWPHLRAQIFPHGRAGIVMSRLDGGYIDYGLREVTSDEAEVLVVPSLFTLSKSSKRQCLGLRGKVTRTAHHFISKPPRSFAIKLLREEITELVHAGRLDESDCQLLAHEKLIGILDA